MHDWAASWMIPISIDRSRWDRLPSKAAKKQRPKRPLAPRKGRLFFSPPVAPREGMHNPPDPHAACSREDHEPKTTTADEFIRIGAPTNQSYYGMGAGQLKRRFTSFFFLLTTNSRRDGERPGRVFIFLHRLCLLIRKVTKSVFAHSRTWRKS